MDKPLDMEKICGPADRAGANADREAAHVMAESCAPLRCPSCGEDDCLGLCRDLSDLGLEMTAHDGYCYE